MKPDFENALRARRTQIRARWLENLLVEPVNTPLANPHMLAFLIDHTLDTVFATLRRASNMRPVDAPACACGRNPFLSYFRAGTQALLEALVLIQAETQTLIPDERDAALRELSMTINRIAQQEIESFGSLCKHRDSAFNKALDSPP